MVTVRGSEKESTVDVYANNRLESGASPITINWRRSLAQVRAGAAIGFRFEEPLPRYGGRGVVESVRIFSRVDDGPIEAVDVAAGGPGAGFRAEYDSGVNYLVRAPQSAKQRVEFWAEVAFREGDGPLAGRRVWESHQSKNFVVEVVPSAPVARVQFDAPAATGFPGAAASGRAAAGGALEVVYDTARMDAIRGERNERKCFGHPYTGSQEYVPGTSGFVSFRDDQGRELRRVQLVGTVAPNTPWSTRVRIPEGSKSAALWFRSACPVQNAAGVVWEEYDSNFGQNFVVSVD